jgi:hypothetical protein
VRSRLRTAATALALLAGAGLGLAPIVEPVWRAQRGREPALRVQTAAAAGQGVTLALLGGFRALVADVAWVRMYALWERRDLPAVETLLRFVTSVDPRPVYFWLNGTRIVAYDFPVWRIAAAGGHDAVPAEVQQRLVREHAALGLRYLGAAMEQHPRSPDLWVEQANIQLNKLGDLDAAAASYRRAWECPRGPFFAARLHAEVLRRAGRAREALEFLRTLHPKLPPNDDAARAELVLARIRDLERELRVPPLLEYRPAR